MKKILIVIALIAFCFTMKSFAATAGAAGSSDHNGGGGYVISGGNSNPHYLVPNWDELKAWEDRLRANKHAPTTPTAPKPVPDHQELIPSIYNGSLTLSSTDLSIPARSGQLDIIRKYDGKVWSFNSSKPFNGYSSMLEKIHRMGIGWDIHPGKIENSIKSDTVYYFTDNGGTIHTLMSLKCDTLFRSTDQEFLDAHAHKEAGYIENWVLRTKSGDRLYFVKDSATCDQNPLQKLWNINKIIDANGNITNYYWHEVTNTPYWVDALDSIVSSSNQRIYFYYNENDTSHYAGLLDSVRTHGPTGEWQTVQYQYELRSFMDPLYFGSPYWDESSMSSANGSTWPFLTKVIYPNGANTRYYMAKIPGNYYVGEIGQIASSGGDSTSYTWDDYSYYFRNPTPYCIDTLKTRQVTQITAYPGSNATGLTTSIYRRVLAGYGGPDSIYITNPDNSASVYKFKSIRFDDTSSIFGALLEEKSLATDGTILARKKFGYQVISKIPLMDTVASIIGNKTYVTRYRDYDCYFNTRRIENVGDVSDTTDDMNTYYEYVHASSSAYDTTHRHILNLVSRQYDSLSSGKLREICYSYDNFNRIDTAKYSANPPVNWTNPMDSVRGLLTSTRVWNGNGYDSARTFYDPCGNVIKTVNPRGDSAKTVYTSKYQYAFPWKSTSYVVSCGTQDSITTTSEYDVYTGLPDTVYGANGDTSYYHYDNMNRLTKAYKSGDGDYPSVIHHYYDLDAHTPVVDSVKLYGSTYGVSMKFFDGFGRLIQSQQRQADGYALIVNAAFDNINRITKTSNPIKTSSAFGSFIDTSSYWSSYPCTRSYYDELSRAIKIVHQDTTRDSVAYHDNIVTSFNAAGDTIEIINNSFGSAKTITDALGHNITNKYDHLGQLTYTINAKGDTTFCYYDTLGRVKGVNSPDAWSSYTFTSKKVDYLLEYDANGNVTTRKNAKAQVHYAYDALNRLTKVDSNGTVKVKYYYDRYNSDTMKYSNSNSFLKGRLACLITAGIDTTWFVYDRLGRLTRKIYAFAGMSGGRDSVRYQYNTAGACSALTYPDGTTLAYNYNSAGQLNSMDNYCNIYYNTSAGQVSSLCFNNAVYDSFRYDNRLRTNRIITNCDGNPVKNHLDLTYTFWETGNVKKIQDNLNSTYNQYFDSTVSGSNVSYDKLGRLRVYKLGTAVITDSLDNVGNRLRERVNGANDDYTYITKTNKLSATLGSTFGYDSCGNVVTRTGGNNVSFSYDYNNMLVKAVIGTPQRPQGMGPLFIGDRTITNTYGFGGSLRIKKTDTGGSTRYYAYEGNNPLVEYDASGNVKKKYVYALGQCIAYLDSAGNKYFMSHDAIGNVRKITNSSGDSVCSYKYYPYGSMLQQNVTKTNDLKFTGKPYVDGIGCYDFTARFYDPEIGRFYSLDPIASSGSPYAYCGNNPVAYTDPTGMAMVYCEPPCWLDVVSSNVARGFGGTGSMDTYEKEHPEFYDLVYEHERISEGLFNAARNNYWRQEYTTECDGNTYLNVSETVFNPISGNYENVTSTTCIASSAADVSAVAAEFQQGAATIEEAIRAAGPYVVPVAIGATIVVTGVVVWHLYKEHTKNASGHNTEKHEKGQERKKRDKGGEKGDARRPYRRK